MNTLNAEPADPQGRKDSGLKPKSFAAVAAENTQSQTSQTNKSDSDLTKEAVAKAVPRYTPNIGNGSINDTHPYAKAAAIKEGNSHEPTFADAAKGIIRHNSMDNSEPAELPNGSKAGFKILNIVDTHGEKVSKEQRADTEENLVSTAEKQREQREQRELDELLKEVNAQHATPIAQKAAERNRDFKINEQNGASPAEDKEERSELEAVGLDEAPKSPTRKHHRKSSSNSKSRPRPSSSSESQGNKSNDSNETIIFEKYEDRKSNDKLTSIKPMPNYEKELVQDRKEEYHTKPDQDKGLVSGREALKSWDKSGIRFAPWNVPLQRRLQTAVVLFHTLCIALSVSLFFFICAIPLFWPLMISYLIYCLTSNASTSGTLRLRSERFRSSPVWSLFASYFPARLHRTEELVPTRKYIFGYHPHGIISHGAFAAFGTEALGFKQLFPGITNSLLTLESNFRIPLYRDYALAMGLASVSKESCENLLTKGGPNGQGMGRAITIVVGGARESLDAIPNTLRLVLKRRLGFIKIAVRTGADLVPVIAFGENDLYDQFMPDEHPKIHRFQLMVKRFMGFTIPLFHARGVFNYDVGLMPYRRPLNIVVGRSIKVQQSAQPSQEVLEKLHKEYMAEVQRLWDTWKDDFASNRREEMQFVE